MKYTVYVQTEIVDGKANVYVGQIDNKITLSFSEMAHILAGGISLLCKLVNEESGENDYALMKEVVDHLNSEFISQSSYSDAEIINKKK